jgi:putative tricarboxylic transport membrane protein
MEKEGKGGRVDRGVGLGAIVLGGVLILSSSRLGPGTFMLQGPGAWPFLLSICLLLLGGWLFFHPDASLQKSEFLPSRWGRFAIALITLIGYPLLLNPLGYLVDTALLLLVQVHWVEGRNWRVSLSTALIGAVVSFVVFGLWLKVYLPAGIIPIRTGAG